MNYKTLNTIRKIPVNLIILAIYPAKIILIPFFAILVFFGTNWEDEWDRKYAIKEFKKILKIGFI